MARTGAYRSVPSPSTPDEATGVPGLGTWTQVYICVGVCFLVWLTLLTLLTLTYS